MKPHLIIALKNIKANKQRSIVTIFLSLFCTAVLIFVSALMDGEHKVFLKSAVEIYPGYIQITNKEFEDNPSFDNLIYESGKVLKSLEKKDAVKTAAARFENFVLFSFEQKSVGAMLTGIEPEKEKLLSKLQTSLHKGEYLNQSDTNKIYIGSELAKRLKVGIGSKLSFIGTGADYSFCADNVIVKGIFQTGLFEFDSNSAFINKPYFDEIFASKNIATHIIVLPKNAEDSLTLSQTISKELDASLVSKSWQEYMKALVDAMVLDSVFGYITLGLFFIVIFFVILIFTLLSVFSRIKEIGVLKAIGTSSKQVFQMLLFESTVLSLIGVIAGGIIGAYLSYYFSINPIELGAEFDETFKQYGLVNTALPTEFSYMIIFRDMTVIFVLNIISMLYPILKVNARTPVEAMNHV